MPLGRWIAIVKNDPSGVLQIPKRVLDVSIHLVCKMQAVDEYRIESGRGGKYFASVKLLKEVITSKWEIDVVN